MPKAKTKYNPNPNKTELQMNLPTVVPPLPPSLSVASPAPVDSVWAKVAFFSGREHTKAIADCQKAAGA